MGKTYETKENEHKEFLQTHYYKCMIDQMIKFVPDVLTEMGCSILSVNEDYNEISAYCDDYDITVKLVMVEINSTSVDVFISSRFIFDFSKTKNVILDLYKRIGKRFEFKGLSLNRDK